MIHEIELTTAEALLTIEVVRGCTYIDSGDKYTSWRAVDKILKSVRQDIKKENQCPSPKSYHNPILNREDEQKELKSCPLCGEDADIKEIINPLTYWDSALRGEHSHTVFCYECGLSIKADNRKEAIDKWNALPRIIRESEE